MPIDALVMAATDPDNVQWQIDFVSSNLLLAFMGNETPGRMKRAVNILRRLKDAGKLTTQQEALLKTIETMVPQEKPN